METNFDFERDVKKKVHRFSYFAYGEASVHFMTLSKAVVVLEGMKDYTRNAFLAAPNKYELENAVRDVKAKFDELLDYFGKSVGLIKACGNLDAKNHVYLLDEAYISLSLYSEAVQRAAKDEGLTSIEERPYTIGVSTGVDG